MIKSPTKKLNYEEFYRIEVTQQTEIKKSFSQSKSSIEQAGMILYVSQKDIEVWEKYIHCMIEKYPLRKCVEICGINLTTVFKW